MPLLIGEVVDGEVKVGMRTPPLKVPDGPECQLSIVAVEVGVEVSDGPWIGLEFGDCPGADDLALLFPPGTTVPLETPA